jgi:hypothetical protein
MNLVLNLDVATASRDPRKVPCYGSHDLGTPATASAVGTSFSLSSLQYDEWVQPNTFFSIFSASSLEKPNGVSTRLHSSSTSGLEACTWSAVESARHSRRWLFPGWIFCCWTFNLPLYLFLLPESLVTSAPETLRWRGRKCDASKGHCWWFLANISKLD